MSQCNSVATPIDKGQELTNDNSELVDSDVPYREAVGSLMYLAVCTRPDIAYAVSLVSQVLNSPTVYHWKIVKRIFKYLKGTLDIGLKYKGDDHCRITAYSDADFAGETSTRRSTTGVVCKFMGAAVTWLSQRQKCVAVSTTEAEFVAASEATKELIWLQRLLCELTNLKDIPVLYVDNLSAVKLVKNPVFHKRSKHIDVRYYFVREKYEEGLINVEHIAGELQEADILTKPLVKFRHNKLCELIGLGNF
jgi:hypothetical protein